MPKHKGRDTHPKKEQKRGQRAFVSPLLNLPLIQCRCGIRYRYRSEMNRCPLCRVPVIELLVVKPKEPERSEITVARMLGVKTYLGVPV